MSTLKVRLDQPNAAIKDFLKDAGFDTCYDVGNADLVLFTGGADVSPHFYGEEIHPQTSYSTYRDDACASLYEDALQRDLPMVGICRGAQFLNVMNGGRLWQHVDKHGLTQCHDMIDVKSGRKWSVTSTHHQMMRPHTTGEVLAIANESTFKQNMVGNSVNNVVDDPHDVEVVWYNLTNCLCFQPHPEYRGDHVQETKTYFWTLFKSCFPQIVPD